MALFQDWIDELLKDPFANEVPKDTEKDIQCCSPEKNNIESCSEYKKIIKQTLSVWPYSTFFDWNLNNNNQRLKGFLPAILQKNIGTTSNELKPGLTEEIYYVNPNYIFFGLNPSRKLNGLPIRDLLNPSEPQDQNNGNFINFTFASEFDRINQKWIDYSKWSNIGYFVKAFDPMHSIWNKKCLENSRNNIFSKFQGSYMTDIASILSVSKGGIAIKCLKNNPVLRNICFSIVKRELEIYKKFVKPNSKEMTIICLGRGTTFSEVTTFAATIGKGLFPGARIIEVGHYARNGHLKLITELDCILKGGKPKNESVWS